MIKLTVSMMAVSLMRVEKMQANPESPLRRRLVFEGRHFHFQGMGPNFLKRIS